MPPRLSRRQQRQQEELLSLSGTSPIQELQNDPKTSDTTENDEPVVNTPNALGFAALAASGANNEEEQEDEEDIPQKAAKKKSKKKKKEAKPILPMQPSQKGNGRKDKGKDKGKTDDGDELDKALAELSMKYPDLQHIAQTKTAGPRSFLDKQNTLLAVSLAHLDSEAEMRKFFGAKVISASKAQDKQTRGARAAIKGLKSNLTKPQPTWWSASQREGLSIRGLTVDELKRKAERSYLAIEETSDRWWTVEYSKRYRNVSKAFIDAVMSGNPDRIHQILPKFPWHADTLLQMSEIYRHREEHSSSADFLNRALFTYERSFIGAFSFTSGANRLDFDYVENRPFYLALSRMVTDLQRRGCLRTAFEFARLLLSLDPYSDPQGAFLFLDFLAIRAGMHEWLLSIWDLHDSEVKQEEKSYDLWHRFNITVLPGWSYARALALRATEETKKQDHEASTAALKEAIFNFPSVVPLLADKIDIYLPGDLRGHFDFRVHIDARALSWRDSLIHLLSHLYASRSSSLWKIPDRATWLKETSISVFNSYDSKKKQKNFRERFSVQFKADRFARTEERPEIQAGYNLSQSIYRHVLALTDANTTRRLTAFFPREILNEPSLSCDPLPPHSAVTRYDNDFFADCEDIFAFRRPTRRERQGQEQILARILGDENVRRQLQAMYDAHPDLQQQFPEGIAQFAQVAALMGDDFWDNYLPPEVVGDLGMPGEFVDADDGDDDEDRGHHRGADDLAAQNDREGDGGDADEGPDEEEERSDEDDDAVQAFPVRVWQNLVNRLWGRAGPAEGNAEAGRPERGADEGNDSI